jgi:hypothetical protein
MSIYYNSKIIKTRISPFPGEILVKQGQDVSPDIAVLRTNYRIGKPCIINLARNLDVPSDEIDKYLLKKEGEKVKWSEPIAKKRILLETRKIESPVDGVVEKIDLKFGIVIIREILERPDVPVILDIKEKFGISINKKDNIVIIKKEGERVQHGETIAGKKIIPGIPLYSDKVISPCSGKVVKIDYENGKIWIQKDLPTVEMKAQYWGKVNKIIPQGGVEIEFSGYVLQGAFGTGDLVWGRLVNSDTDIKGNIIFREYLSYKKIKKIIMSQPAGIIVNSIDYEGIELLNEQGFASVIVEGFGKLKINEDYEKLLEHSFGKNVIIIGITQLRAGVIRPEIIIPSDKEFYKPKKTKGAVKIIWGKYYGNTGEIKKGPYLGKTNSGVVTWLCDLSCANGKMITLPFNNVMKY